MKPDNPSDDQKKLRGMKLGVFGLGAMGKPMARNLHSGRSTLFEQQLENARRVIESGGDQGQASTP